MIDYLHIVSERTLLETKAAIDAAYLADERARRGLPPGASLDVRGDGTPAAPITTGYVGIERVDGVTGGLLTVDERVREYQGVAVPIAGKPVPVVIDVARAKPMQELPPDLREPMERKRHPPPSAAEPLIDADARDAGRRP